jgi:putative flippase GtrA
MRSESGLTEGVGQFTKFVIVGCVNVAVGFAFFILFYRYFPPLAVLGAAGDFVARMGVSSPDAGIAYMLGAATGMATSFVLNKYWTFGALGFGGPQFRRFVVLNVLNISASTALISLLVDLAGVPYLSSWIAITGLAMLVNFFVNKYWTFASTSHDANVATRAVADGGL